MAEKKSLSHRASVEKIVAWLCEYPDKSDYVDKPDDYKAEVDRVNEKYKVE
jgi:hypothetical protein